MIAQIYVKTINDDVTSILVSNDKGNIYFQDVIDTPELTGIQRGVSFVKHQLDTDKTEIYPDKLKGGQIMKDVYINWCKVKQCIGENPNPDMVKECQRKLQQAQRWNTRGGRDDR